MRNYYREKAGADEKLIYREKAGVDELVTV